MYHNIVVFTKTYVYFQNCHKKFLSKGLKLKELLVCKIK